MIFVSRKNSIGSKSVAREVHAFLFPLFEKYAEEFNFDEDVIERIEHNFMFYTAIYLDELNIPQFNLVYHLIDKHWVTGHWCEKMKPLLLELMQADPRFDKQSVA